MTTHLNENLAEIALAKQIHECDTYLGIYDKVLFVSLFLIAFSQKRPDMEALFSKRDLILKREHICLQDLQTHV